mgnify:CR=1 FL=1
MSKEKIDQAKALYNSKPFVTKLWFKINSGFDEDFIDNDLVIVNEAIREYYAI